MSEEDKQALLVLIRKNGLRSVFNALADLCTETAGRKQSLPYYIVDQVAESMVDADDLLNAAEILRGDMW